MADFSPHAGVEHFIYKEVVNLLVLMVTSPWDLEHTCVTEPTPAQMLGFDKDINDEEDCPEEECLACANTIILFQLMAQILVYIAPEKPLQTTEVRFTRG